MTLYAERLLPHNLEAEEAVIGSLLIDGECFSRVAPVLQPGDFYRERNQLCFAAAMALFQRDQAIDQLTLAGELARTEKLDEVGGMAYLSHLVSITPTSAHSEEYAEIVSRTSTMRSSLTPPPRFRPWATTTRTTWKGRCARRKTPCSPSVEPVKRGASSRCGRSTTNTSRAGLAR